MSDQVRGTEGIVYLRLEQVEERTALSKSTIYDKLNPRSPRHDPSFPKQVKLGRAAARWVSSELDAWMASRRDANGAPVPKDVPVPTSNERKGGAKSMAENKSSPLADINEQRRGVVRALLEKHAKRGERVFYRDVMQKTMLSPDVPEDCKVFDEILANLSTASHSQHNVLIGALVFEEGTGKRCPKKAFFDLADSLGYTYRDPEAFVENQIIKLYELFEDPADRAKGKLVWMRIRTKRFLTRQG